MPIRQGARPFKTPKEHETEPGRDVSWLLHLPVSGMVKLLSWGVTLGVHCVLLRRAYVYASVYFTLGNETPLHSSELRHTQHADIVLSIYVALVCVHTQT